VPILVVSEWQCEASGTNEGGSGSSGDGSRQFQSWAMTVDFKSTVVDDTIEFGICAILADRIFRLDSLLRPQLNLIILIKADTPRMSFSAL